METTREVMLFSYLLLQHNNLCLFASANLMPGVRYSISLYSCSSEPAKLLQHWQGYMQELGKDGIAWEKAFPFIRCK